MFPLKNLARKGLKRVGLNTPESRYACLVIRFTTDDYDRWSMAHDFRRPSLIVP